MDIAEVAQTAGDALSSAKSAHHRIDALEAEVRDIRSLTAAMAAVNEKVDNLKSDMDDIKSDVKAITGRSGQWWDEIVAAAIGAVSTGIVVAILNVILK